MKRVTKKRAVIAGVVASVAISATAFAYFTSTGAGSGSASVGSSTTWAVTTVAATGGPLTPGGPIQTVGYSVKNNSTGHQNLANVAVKVANSDGTTWTSGTCSAADFRISGAAAGATFNDTAPAANLAPGATATSSVTVAMIDTGVNQDDCKDATVPLYLSAT